MRSIESRLAFLEIAILLAIPLSTATSLKAQECRDEQPGHVVRSIRIQARWLPPVELPLKPGDEFTPDKLRETRLRIVALINEEKRRYNSEFVKLGRLQLLDVNLVRACVRKIPPPECTADGLIDKCVDIEVKPLALSSDPVFMAAVLLPIPRSNRQTFLSGVPRLLRMFDPRFGAGGDGEVGITPDFDISTDLLSLNDIAQNRPANARRASLILKGRGSRSLSEGYYTSEARLSFRMSQPSTNLESLGVETSFTADRGPQPSASYLRNSFRLNGRLALIPAMGILNRIVLSGGYRRSRDRLIGESAQPSVKATENTFEGRVMTEGRLFDGFSRGSMWFDVARPTAAASSYKRVAGLFGYEKEIPLGQQTIGVEALFGAGHASSETPEYNLFFGGNALGDFIYQDITNPESLSSLPAGPVLRSFGRNQAGFRVNDRARGANSFQHFNLTIAIPIPHLAAPLIPDEVVNPNPRTTLRDLIDFAVNSGQEALSLSYQDEGLSEESADKKAARIFDEIRPGIKYLSHYAKVYSLRPLIMFDQARFGRIANPTQSRYSIGGGIELTVVIARFQASYLHALKRFDGESRGNFVMRLVFTNLF